MAKRRSRDSRVLTSFRLPKGLIQALGKYADENDLVKTSVVEDFIRDGLANAGRPLATTAGKPDSTSAARASLFD